MKSRWILIGLVLAAIVLFGIASVWDSYRQEPHGRKSAFLANYKPDSVIERFRVIGEEAAFSHGNGGGTRDFTRSFEGHFIIRSVDRMALINALRDDVSGQLEYYGANILNQTGNPEDGFRYDYKLGKSVGTVTIAPVEISDTLQRSRLLPKGNVEVSTEIKQTEEWNPIGI